MTRRAAVVHAFSELTGAHSHDAADSVDKALESSERGIRALKISFLGLLLTAAVQAGLVMVTGSVALLADTIHNFSDALTAIPLFVAFKLGQRAANRRYTYGYRRAEDLAGLFIVLMIFASAVLAAWESIERLVNPREVRLVGIVFLAGVVGFLGNELVAIYRIRVGRAIGSAALVADGKHARADGLTSLAVAAGAAGVWLGFERADPLVGILVWLAILAVLRTATRDIYRRLMDAVDPELVGAIEEEACSIAGVASVGAARSAGWVTVSGSTWSWPSTDHSAWPRVMRSQKTYDTRSSSRSLTWMRSTCTSTRLSIIPTPATGARRGDAESERATGTAGHRPAVKDRHSLVGTRG